MVWLSSLDLTQVETGGHHKPMADKSRDGNPLSLGGRIYEKGVGMEARTQMVIQLDGGTTSFHAVVGIDDDVAPGQFAKVEFRVMGDSRRLLWTSGVMERGHAPKVVDVDLTGVKTLTLLAKDDGDWHATNHADWADARFEVVGVAPRAINANGPTEIRDRDPQPEISMEPAPATPKFQAPGLIAARPGKPIFYQLPVTGARPLKFSAKGLPDGVSIDPLTGCISGAMAKAGDYTLALQVENAAGAGRTNFHLVVGDTLALTPPMGWNSFDNFGARVKEKEYLENAAYLAKELQPYGWLYAVIDFLWFDPNPYPKPGERQPVTMDEYGRLLPCLDRFPSAAQGRGFKPIADQVHAMGLRFGIHIMRGIPKAAVEANLPIEGSPYRAADAANTSDICSWDDHMYGVKGDTPAGQAYYDSIFRLYASWDLDFIKVDDISSPYLPREVAAIHRAIEKCSREIVLSLSPGAAPVSAAEHARAHAQMWRMTGDFWDNWDQLENQFDRARLWTPYSAVGHWPDADMLPIGHLGDQCVGLPRESNFSRAEQMTLLSFCALLPSPLMIGADLRRTDAWTLALLTNPEVLAVNQDSRGAAMFCVAKGEGYEVWAKPLADGSLAVGLFNLGNDDAPVRATWAGLKISGERKVRDLWLRRDLGKFNGQFEAMVKSHGVVLIRL
jgi:hypothetical protein